MNVSIENHPMIGTTFVWSGFPDLNPEIHGYEDGDIEPGFEGQLIVGNGDTCQIEHVFHNWNDVAGLTVAYVKCFETGEHTHFSVHEMGLEYSWRD
jgi:hypothetical protein